METWKDSKNYPLTNSKNGIVMKKRNRIRKRKAAEKILIKK